ncbi:bifunctional diaminohydroxyphosphoribosylaminopyrimidine deaminase/5-amino-6-(5-phosphoribosylamino)uracil reductase RibD [Syntrophus sp. (in: bacteria)]|uniref:bifunctional diaminohydroxyphosphoribosylaminopyrimidine deaminase/5-amino-6-(5-phosphoribosylamino)uracil reductase RibD n=1 Tax=Syntrophus sp. (in: bacteria) TaxID=48412 RepID=UPI00345E0A15
MGTAHAKGKSFLNDESFMKRALRLARKGEGWVSPNPMVGSVVVRNNRIIGEGYHRKFGQAHAEINALESVTESAEGSTIYVTLEPCSHYGKTPPCVDRLIACRPQRVVIGTADPNPLVAGKGIEALQRSGVPVSVGVLEEACRQINEAFFKFIQSRTPFVTLKYAQTLDGRIATATGHSRWISSLPSRRFAHRLRHAHDAIMVGIGTVLSDDPELTVRLVRGKNPLRIVLDSRLRIPLTSHILQDQGTAGTLLVATDRADGEKLARLRDLGIDVLILPADPSGRIVLPSLFRELGTRNIASVLVEGGSGVLTALLAEDLADRLVAIVAPKIAGKGIEAVGDLNITDMKSAIGLIFRRTYRKGDDLIIDARLRGPA